LKDFIRRFREKYVNYETITYIIFGVLTTLVDWGIFALLNKVFAVPALAANIVSTAAAILFAFFTNKFIVFRSMSVEKTHLLVEFGKFVSSRLLTFLLQELLLWINEKWIGLDAVVMKMLTSVIVIILNYFLSKLFIFKKEKSDENQTQLP